MKKIDEAKIADFYNHADNVWEQDAWYDYTTYMIQHMIQKANIPSEDYILNAGSGGSTYGLENKMNHLDIANDKISQFPLHTVSSIEDTPFIDATFETAICVGSVLNYCNATETIHELNRVLKPKGKLLLEFESSASFEYANKPYYGNPHHIVDLAYEGQVESQWIYSPKYILDCLAENNFTVRTITPFHILSAIAYRKQDEQLAAKWSKLDFIFRHLPYFKERRIL